MICILKIENERITGWIIATDTHDARRQADNIGERDLATWLYRMEFAPSPGKYVIGPHLPRPLSQTEDVTDGHLMLVS